MGAMLVGLALSIPLMFFIFISTTVLVALTAFCAYKNKLSVLWWSIAAVVLNYIVLIPLIIVLLKIDKLKCPDCGTSTKNNTGICPNCNASVKRINDKKIIQIILLTDGIIFAVFSVLCTLVPFLLN